MPTEIGSLTDRSRIQSGGSDTTLQLANQLKTRQTRLLSQPLQHGENFEDLQTHHRKSSMKPDNRKIKIPKKKLEEMLNGIKEELYAESTVSDTQRVFDEENLFNDSRLSKESMNKDKLKKVIKRVDKLKSLKAEISARPDEEDSPQGYYEKYMEYAKQANEFYGMLNYFQHSNPTLYKKVSNEVHGQIENNLLGKFNLLHLKQSPPNSSAPDFVSTQTRSSRFNMKLPPLSTLPQGNFNIGATGRGSMTVARGSMTVAHSHPRLTMLTP